MSNTVSRLYSGFRGVDFRGEECNLSRSPDALNIWRDYREIDGIRTRPGLSVYSSTTGKINGIFFYKGFTLIHKDSTLYKLVNGAYFVLFSGVKNARSQAFIFADIWYFKDGEHYLRYDGSTGEIGEVIGYIPTTSIARKPMGGGVTHEEVNMLSDYRINTFVADGTSARFVLDAVEIDADYVPVITVNGESVANGFEIDAAAGEIEFSSPPSSPLTDGQDNVSIMFKKTVARHQDRIQKCTLLQVFDNRVFFSGNPDMPNYMWHSSLNDPSYISDLDYYEEGMDDSPVRGMVAGNDALWIFRQPGDSNTNVFYHKPTLDSKYGKIYPSAHSGVSTGCVGAAVNFNDDIVFFSERGMEGVSGGITSEQAFCHRSSLVDRLLLSENGYKNMITAEWEGYLLVFIGNHVYLADSRAVFQNENHYEYEWFYWELEDAVGCVAVNDGTLYIGADGKIYTLTDRSVPVNSHWVTAKDKFGYPNMQKTANKRGCVAEALGDLSVYVCVEGREFEFVESYEGVGDHCVIRLKQKKFKDLQIKLSSSTRFSLESIALECFIGGYIKR